MNFIFRSFLMYRIRIFSNVVINFSAFQDIDVLHSPANAQHRDFLLFCMGINQLLKGISFR